jgi:hypothetical protein
VASSILLVWGHQHPLIAGNGWIVVVSNFEWFYRSKKRDEAED